jgi:hypothetical protein
MAQVAGTAESAIVSPIMRQVDVLSSLSQQVRGLCLILGETLT